MKPKNKKRLSEKEFAQITRELQLSEKTKEIAYGVLVLGIKQKVFADKYNITPSAVSSLCARIYNALNDKKTGKLSDEEFEKISNELQLSEKSKEISYGVLVLGIKQKVFADKYNITPSAVSLLCARVYNTFRRKMQKIPEGYERVDVILPSYKAFLVKQWALNHKKMLAEDDD